MVDYRSRHRRKASRSDDERFSKRGSGNWIDVRGRVVRLLPDDIEGDKHQRLIVDAGDRQTLLVAHNVDIAERVPVSLGDRLSIRGMFEWNELGGLIHWTHRDPMGVEEGGYIEHRNKQYA